MRHLSQETALEVVSLAETLNPPEEGPKVVSSRQLADAFMEELAHPNPARRQLRELINGLSSTEQAELMAMMWLGRGDFEPEDWEEMVRKALSDLGDAADYMIGKGPVAKYLKQGMALRGWGRVAS